MSISWEFWSLRLFGSHNRYSAGTWSTTKTNIQTGRRWRRILGSCKYFYTHHSLNYLFTCSKFILVSYFSTTRQLTIHKSTRWMLRCCATQSWWYHPSARNSLMPNVNASVIWVAVTNKWFDHRFDWSDPTNIWTIVKTINTKIHTLLFKVRNILFVPFSFFVCFINNYHLKSHIILCKTFFLFSTIKKIKWIWIKERRSKSTKDFSLWKIHFFAFESRTSVSPFHFGKHNLNI